MGKYTQELIDRVASAFALACDDTYLFGDDPRYPGLGPHSEDYISEMRDGAVAVLEELGWDETT